MDLDSEISARSTKRWDARAAQAGLDTTGFGMSEGKGGHAGTDHPACGNRA
jgi:hypothetical protein